MNGRDFLPVAIHLATGPAEGYWRSSVSRSYYAAFHVARGLLRRLGFAVPPSEKAHLFLYLRLNNCGHSEVENSASDLNDLRLLRNQADYDENGPIGVKDAHDQILVAQDIIRQLDTLTQAERTRIRETMKIYERDVLQNVTWRP